MAFASRDMLRATSLEDALVRGCPGATFDSNSADIAEEAVMAAASEPDKLAYGQSMNLVDINTGRAWNVETGPGSTCFVLEVAPGAGGAASKKLQANFQPFFHGNEYEYLKAHKEPREQQSKDTSTKYRRERFQELVSQGWGLSPQAGRPDADKASSDHVVGASGGGEGDDGGVGGRAAADVANFLGDGNHARWPVFRTGAKRDGCMTVMSWVLDRGNGVLNVWAGPSPAVALGHAPNLIFSLDDISEDPKSPSGASKLAQQRSRTVSPRRCPPSAP